MSERALLAGLLVAAAITVWTSSWPLERVTAVVRGPRAAIPPAGAGDVFFRWARAPRCWVVAVAAAAIAATVDGPVVGGLAAAATAVGARGLLRRREAALESARRAAAVDVAMALAAELRAGQPLGVALAAAGEVAGPLRAGIQEAAGVAALGHDPAPVLRANAELPGAGGLQAIAAAWTVASQAGAALSPALVAVAAGLDEEERTRHEVQAQLAGPRATGRALTALPLLGVGMAASIGAHPGRLLLHTGWGALLCATAAGLVAAGHYWLERLAHRAVAP